MVGQTKTQAIDGNSASSGRAIATTLLLWLFLPVLFYVVYEWLFHLLPADFEDADISLLVFQAGLSVLIVGFVLISKRQSMAGWKKSHGWFWLAIVGPLWISVLTPIAAAAEFYQSAPANIVLFFAISALVGLNEETVFRGLMLSALMRHFRPLIAALISSLAFGCLHLLNLNSGGEIVFVLGQVIVAAGTGAVMAALTLSCKSTIPAIVLHLVLDFVGLGALGGYEQAIQSSEIAPILIVSGLVFMAWGLFWCWRIQRQEALAA